MPKAPKRPCAKNGCPSLVQSGERYCPLHKAEERRRYDNTPGRKQDKRFYASARWLATRNHVLRGNPICQICNHNVSTIAHHVIPRKQDATKELEITNIIGVCNGCHERVHKCDRWGGAC